MVHEAEENNGGLLKPYLETLRETLFWHGVVVRLLVRTSKLQYTEVTAPSLSRYCRGMCACARAQHVQALGTRTPHATDFLSVKKKIRTVSHILRARYFHRRAAGICSLHRSRVQRQCCAQQSALLGRARLLLGGGGTHA